MTKSMFDDVKLNNPLKEYVIIELIDFVKKLVIKKAHLLNEK